MFHLQQKIKELGLGEHPADETDFYEICARENIGVIRDREPFSYWINLDGEHYIVLHTGLRGYRMLFTMFHELAHHFLHAGRELNQIEAFGGHESSKEWEADVFAVLSIYPLTCLSWPELREAEEYDSYLYKLRIMREKLHFLYGI